MPHSASLFVTDATARGAGDTVREIAQQPDVWRKVCDDIKSKREAIDTFLTPILERPKLRIILTGAGTSAFAGQILVPTLSSYLGRPVEALATTDIVSRPTDCFPDARPVLLISFARSGNSPESIAAAQLADHLSAECHHLVVTCNPDGKLFKDHRDTERSLVLTMPAVSDDQGFAMTSSVTAMMLAVLATFSPNLVDSAAIDRIVSATDQILVSSAERIKTLSKSGFQRIVYLGSGSLNSLARESALKILELTAGRTLAYHDTPLGFRHGPKSLLDRQTLVIVFVSNDAYSRRYDLDIIAELSEQLDRHSVVAITTKEIDGLSKESTFLIEGLENDAEWTLTFPYLIHAQLLALHSSLALGKTPDDPFPSGEVNRVVQGVTIHPFETPGHQI